MKINNREQLNQTSNQESIFTQFEEGKKTVRVMTDIYAVKEHRVQIDGRWRFIACPTENLRMKIKAGVADFDADVPPCPLCELGYPVRTAYLTAIVEREYEEFDKETGEKTLKGGNSSILKKGATIFGPIQDLLDDPAWGRTGKYDIVITATGKDLERKYSVIPVPVEKSKPLSPKELKNWDEFAEEQDLDVMTTPRGYEEIQKIIGKLGEYKEKEKVE